MATKLTRKIKKMQHSREYRILSIIIVILISFIAYFFYEDTQEDYIYSSSQDALGYYYYVEANEASDYYHDANLLIGVQLENRLQSIIENNFQPVSYNDARIYLVDADRSLTDRSKIWNIYDGTLVDDVWDAGLTWNREHVWPNARLGMDRVDGTDKNQASDLHNLRAAVPSVNSTRSDRFYSEGTGEWHITDDHGFYPGDEHVGDVARILFYMIVMYDYLDLTEDINLLLDEADHYTLAGARMGILDVLFKWHRRDPVDDFERQRNDIIYQAQGNRNPFIDHPEYIHLIWENKTIEDITYHTEQVQIKNQFILIIEESKRSYLI